MNINLSEVLQNEWSGIIDLLSNLTIDLLECTSIENLALTIDSIEIIEDGFYINTLNCFYPSEKEAIYEMDEYNESIDNEDLKITFENLTQISYYLEYYSDPKIQQIDMELTDKKYFDKFRQWVKELEVKNDLYKTLSRRLNSNPTKKKSCKI